MQADVVKALAPAFAAGFAIQRLFEILDKPLTGAAAKLQNRAGPSAKHLMLNLTALAIGLVLSFAAGLQVLQPLGVDAEHLGPAVANARLLDGIVTGLIISGGTEGLNSIMKFLGYAKQKENPKSGSSDGGTTPATAG
jgi:hypothetical protein